MLRSRASATVNAGLDLVVLGYVQEAIECGCERGYGPWKTDKGELARSVGNVAAWVQEQACDCDSLIDFAEYGLTKKVHKVAKELLTAGV